MCRSAREGRPRCFGGTQRDGGTCSDSSSCIVQQWSVIPAAMAGVVLCAWDKLMRSTKLPTMPTTNIPSCRVRVWRASARHQRCEAFPERRVQPLNVRCIDHAVSLRPTQEVSTRAGVPSTMRRSVATMPPLVVFDDLGDQNMAPRTKPWPSAHAHVHGIAETSPCGAGCRIPSHPYRSRGADMPHSA